MARPHPGAGHWNSWTNCRSYVCAMPKVSHPGGQRSKDDQKRNLRLVTALKSVEDPIFWTGLWEHSVLRIYMILRLRPFEYQWQGQDVRDTPFTARRSSLTSPVPRSWLLHVGRTTPRLCLRNLKCWDPKRQRPVSWVVFWWAVWKKLI